MVSNVNNIITSGDLGGGLNPTEYSTQIIQDAPKTSVSLTRTRQIRMSTRTRTQPVLDSKPIAYWVGGDTGLKQTTKMKWSGLSITAEELAAIVPIPEAVIADSGIPLWGGGHAASGGRARLQAGPGDPVRRGQTIQLPRRHHPAGHRGT